MPWKEQTQVSQRSDFVRAASVGGANISALCRAFDISRRIGYKWLGRYQREGAAGLEPRSRRPHHSPEQTPTELEARVVAARQRHPTWGARKLRAWLAEQGVDGLPAASTIHAILGRHGLLDPGDSAAHRPFQAFERAAPNELWQMDFKGDFALPAGGRCHPLTVLDDHSRFLLGLAACANERTETVQQHLTAIFRRYGLPAGMLMDNGSPWGDDAQTRWTRFTVWLLRLDIRVTHGRPYHPQTQGKAERLHRTLGEDVLAAAIPATLRESQCRFDAWRQVYNEERPHEALGQQPPARRYQPSPRPFPDTLPELIYPAALPLRKVGDTGKLTFHNRQVHAGRGFAGQHVAVQADCALEGHVELYFGPTCIGVVPLHPIS